MAALKLYFILVSDDSPIQVSVHRDLATLHDSWRQTNRETSMGIIHVGFIRPKIQNAEVLLRHQGKVLVSVAAKWALPEEYQSSIAVIAEIKLATKEIPLYLLLKGMGCNQEEPSAVFQPSPVGTADKNELTIAEAALLVLNDSEGSLNRDEIFAQIVAQSLYQFGAAKPLVALEIELNRHTQGTEYSKAVEKPVFRKADNGRYFSLENEVTNASGWVKQLGDDQPDIAEAARSHGIHHEASYEQLSHSVPVRLRDQLDVCRFAYLVRSIDSEDPVSLVNILPQSLLTANISSLDLPVRISNVFRVQNIASLAELSDLSVDAMLRWPNFGRKSLGDFCAVMIEAVDELYNHLGSAGSGATASETMELFGGIEESDQTYHVALVTAMPLKAHFAKALSGLKDKDRQIIECRTGYNGTVMTLEAVGQLVGVTRERIRQIQKKYVAKIMETEFWDDCIALKIGQLLIDRNAPLYIEMLEIEDPWFEGFMGNYQHLAAIIELFSENEILVINIGGASVVSRIRHDAWDESVSNFRKSLKDKAEEGNWSRRDIEQSFHAELSDKGAQELVPLMWDEFKQALQFGDESSEARLLTFGVSAESVVQAVLLQAESPLHYSEVAVRATELLGKPVDERRAQNALMSQGAKLYGRGIYGLGKFNPISPRMCKNIQLVVGKMMYDGPLMKQWHASEILTALQAKFSALPKELDNYILNIILQDSDNLAYLNRMVWVRSDSNQSVNDRVDMADAFTKILEDNGGPLKGKELKERLAAIRGVPKSLQLHATERMILVGPDLWGLAERDVGGAEDNGPKLDILYKELKARQKGIHVSEIPGFVEVSDDSKQMPSAYALMNLAQRDDRFYLGRAMFLGLAEWEGDTRRLNLSQAIRFLLTEIAKPMALPAIQARLEELMEIKIESSITALLINEGFVYDQEGRQWFK